MDMILETLPESFDTFKLKYPINKPENTFTKLMKDLHTAEGLTKRKRNQREAHAPEHKASTSGSKKRPHRAEKKTVLPLSNQRDVVLY